MSECYAQECHAQECKATDCEAADRIEDLRSDIRRLEEKIDQLLQARQ